MPDLASRFIEPDGLAPKAAPKIRFGLLSRAQAASVIQILTVLALGAISLHVASNAHRSAIRVEAEAGEAEQRATQIQILLNRFRLVYSSSGSEWLSRSDWTDAVTKLHTITHAIRGQFVHHRDPSSAARDRVLQDALRPVLDAMDTATLADAKADAAALEFDALTDRAIDMVGLEAAREAIERQMAADANADAEAAFSIAIGCATLALIASLIGLLNAQNGLLRVRQIARALSALAGGHLDITLPSATARDEVGSMAFAAHAFRGTLAELLERRAELREANERIGTALNSLRIAVVLFDARQRMLLSNRAFQEWFAAPVTILPPGAPATAVMGHVLGLCGMPPEQIEREIAAIWVTVSAGVRLDAERALADGRVVSIEAYVTPERGLIVTYEDVTARRRSEQQIAFLAQHDALTGLANRVLVRDRLAAALAGSARQRVAVLCMDLDQFAPVNEQLGHDVGDALLVSVAHRLSALLREGDTLGRLGADEFAIVQNGPDRPSSAAALAQRVVAAIGAPFEVQGHSITLGITIGIAMAPTDGQTAEQLLRCADLALVRAKSASRGAWQAFDSSMDATAQARRTLETDLREAVAAESFELYYQPLVSMADRRVSGFEALVRWRHPQRGMVSPGEFIPLCEELGLIGPLGVWVLASACAEATTWPAHLKIAVNLSPVQFRGSSVAETVAAVLAKTGLRPQRLELEITESVLLTETEDTLAQLHALRAMGVRISMDDFGTGYSSLSYLRSFPFDKIKIDRSFIIDMHERGESAAIVRAVAGLGASLGITTTAEGVETKVQLDRVAAEGCDEVQGYYFSPPRPASELPAMIRALESAADELIAA